MISRPHYHLATGHESKNRGQIYKCQNTGINPPFESGCVFESTALEANGELIDFSKPQSVPCKDRNCKYPLYRHFIDTSLDDKPHWTVFYGHHGPTNPTCCLWLSEKEALRRIATAKA